MGAQGGMLVDAEAFGNCLFVLVLGESLGNSTLLLSKRVVKGRLVILGRWSSAIRWSWHKKQQEHVYFTCVSERVPHTPPIMKPVVRMSMTACDPVVSTIVMFSEMTSPGTTAWWSAHRCTGNRCSGTICCWIQKTEEKIIIKWVKHQVKISNGNCIAIQLREGLLC